MALFLVTQDAALEQAIYDGVGQDTVVDADGFDALDAVRLLASQVDLLEREYSASQI